VAQRQEARVRATNLGNAHGTLCWSRWCPVDDQPEEER
jgi:hypothetical protein